MTRSSLLHLAGAGIGAGVVLNLTNAFWGAALPRTFSEQLGDSVSSAPNARAVFSAYALGLTAVWLDHFIRRRGFRPSRSVGVAALAVWFVVVGIPSYLLSATGFFDSSLLPITAAFGSAQLVVATFAGSWFYNWLEARSLQTVRRQAPIPGAMHRVETAAKKVAKAITPLTNIPVNP